MNPTQAKLYNLLTKDQLTIKQAARRMNKSTTWLYRVRKTLIRDGYLSGPTDLIGRRHFRGGYWGGSPRVTSAQNHRLHAEIFTVKLMGGLTFQENLGIVKYIDSNKYIVYKSAVVIYGLKSFYGDLETVLFESSKYWTAVLLRLSHQLGINFLDPNLASISLSRSHISKVGDPLAKQYNQDNHKLKVLSEDGKVRLLIDNSYNLHELEAVDSRTNIQDTQAINNYFSDLLGSNHFKPSEVKVWVEALKEISAHNSKSIGEVKKTIAYIVSKMGQK